MLPASERSLQYFNSRPREGANFKQKPVNIVLYQFQFPPPRGGELPRTGGVASYVISIPAPARGRTNF